MFVKGYRKKNGELMVYLNGKNRVSVGVSDRVYTSKLTNGQKNTLSEFWASIKAAPAVYEGVIDTSAHKEDMAVLDLGLTFFVTDVAEVAGIKVDSDGGYIYDKDSKKLVNIADIR